EAVRERRPPAGELVLHGQEDLLAHRAVRDAAPDADVELTVEGRRRAREPETRLRGSGPALAPRAAPPPREDADEVALAGVGRRERRRLARVVEGIPARPDDEPEPLR